MAFRFALRTLLRVRENVEKARWQELQKALASLRTLSEELHVLDSSRDRQREHLQSLMTKAGIRASELHFWTEYELHHVQRRQALVHRIAELQKLCVAALQTFHQARRDRETVSELRNRAHDAYQREAAKKEQAASDENFILGRSYRV